MAQKPKPPPPPPPPVADAHKIGYARVSAADQNPQLQIDALLRAGVDPLDIFEEKVSGTARNRPVLDAMMKDIRPGDVIIVWRLDRLGRNAMHLHQIAMEIQAKGAHLRLLDNSGLDTTTAAGRMMFAMLAAMAQFERDLTYERTMAGLASARANGRAGGRKARFTDEQVLEAHRLHGVAGGARSLVYTEGKKIKHMSKTGFLKALERAQQKENADEQT
jgi:DNA invertase Pin-like site-specific DNA recombinase